MKLRGRCLPVFCALLALLCCAVPSGAAGEQGRYGWHFPTIGAGNGTWRLSVGTHFWSDHLEFRNLQFQGDLDLGRGLRLHTVLRSNDEMNGLGRWAPRVDEGYLEAYGFHTSPSGTVSLSARIGRTRYLRFPYPDAIALFDQVPGIGDLKGGEETGYSGAILTADYAHKSGFGLHGTWIDWGFGSDRGAGWAERYVYYRGDSGPWHFEARYGDLPVRKEPVGQTEEGFNLFAGYTHKDWTIGFLYEELDDQPAHTGIVVRFSPSDKTRKMGELAFDYTRSPQGFAMQIPLAVGTFGRVRRISADEEPYFTGVLHRPGKKGYLEAQNYVLVGEVKAERIRTYWQNGQNRNWYEHRLSHWGDTSSPGLTVIMVEEPWYLELEALVSPHTDLWSWDDLQQWEEDRMGPAQLNQKVTYRFYRKR